MMDWQTITPELQKKLDPANVKPAKAYGPKGDYIEGWHAMAEANAIFGFGGWSYTVTQCQCVAQGERAIGKDKKPGFGVTYTAMVRVMVGDVVREDFGAGHGYDVDLGLAHESAVKEAVTDALKRAMRGFGNRFGLALYDKTRANVGDSSDERVKPSESIAQPDYSTAEKNIRAAQSIEALRGIWESLEWDLFPDDWRLSLTKEKDARLAELKKPRPAPAKSALDSLNELQPGNGIAAE